MPSASSGAFTASEAVTSSSVSGDYTRLANGFIQMTVTGSSGGLAPANGAVRYALELPGFSLFSEPVLSSETKVIATIASGSCPTQTWTGILLYFIWSGSTGTSFDVSSASTPAFGLFSWNPATQTVTISEMRNLTSYSTLGGFSSFAMAGSCSAGVITFSGTGDRGGTLYLSPSRGGIYAAQTQRSVLVIPQFSLPAAANLNGNYAMFRLSAETDQDVAPARLTISGGTGGTGYELSSVPDNTSDTAKRWDLSNITINTPIDGVFTADVAYNLGTAAKAICGTFINTRTLIFCATQDPITPSQPQNFMLVSDALPFASATVDSYSFGTGGQAATDFGSGTTDQFYGVALQSDGRIVAVGKKGSSADVVVTRSWDNGTLDTTFSGDGITYTTIQASRDDIAQAVLIQMDGKVMTVGRTNTGSSNIDFLTLRYLTDGSLDTSWDSDGIRVDTFSNKNEVFFGVSQQSDGKIIASGYCGNGSNYDVCVYRYSTTGTLDSTFASSGKFNGQMGTNGSDDTYFSALASDGKIYTFGSDNGANAAILRLTTAGALDTTFNGSGYHVASFSGSTDLFYGGALQPDGKPVACGYDGIKFAFARFTTAGALDTTFNSSGKLTFTFPSPMGVDSVCNAVAVQGDGKIVGVGWALGTNKDFAVMRLTTGGVLDTTFDSDGTFYTSGGTSDDRLEAVTIQADGKILASGMATGASSNQNSILLRLWP